LDIQAENINYTSNSTYTTHSNTLLCGLEHLFS